jgi:hypothetical protein
MGSCNSPDIFEEQMSTNIEDLDICRACIDDLLVLSKGSWEQHLHNLETIIHCPQQKAFKSMQIKPLLVLIKLITLGTG